MSVPVHVSTKAVVEEANVDVFGTGVVDNLNKFLVSKYQTATSPIGEDHKPRILKITGWAVHAPNPNRNRLAFVPEELEATVLNGQWSAPNFPIIDLNHDFTPRGVWYDAEYAFDEDADQFGIRAEGVLFAWRFEELADAVLATQHRQGHIDLSMSSIARMLESKRDDAGQSYTLAREPVFFTTSILQDQPPAFPRARGVGSESPTSTKEERQELLNASVAQPNEEFVMDEIMERLEALLAEVAEERRPDVERIIADAKKAAQMEVELATKDSRIAELEAELTAKVAELETKAGEIEELNLAHEATNQDLAVATEELESLRAFKAEAEADAEARQLEARKEVRLAQVHPSILKVLNEKDEEYRETVIASWLSESDDEWVRTLEVLNAGRKPAAEAGEDEGRRSDVLPTSADLTGDGWEISKYLNR